TERGWRVQPRGGDGEGVFPSALPQGAGVRQRRRALGATRPDALRERVQPVAAANSHVNEEGTARRDLPHTGGPRPERHHLAVLGQVGDGAALGHVDGPAPHLQPGRDDVGERSTGPPKPTAAIIFGRPLATSWSPRSWDRPGDPAGGALGDVP